MSFRDHIDACNNADLDAHVPMRVAGQRVGHIRKDRLDTLAEVGGDVFEVSAARDQVTMDPALDTAAVRTAAVEDVVQSLMQRGEIQPWRGERYPCLSEWATAPWFELERAAVPWFGITAYGVHVNGFVRDGEAGEIAMWVARRSREKPTYPGMLDNMVAGGHPIGLGLLENVIKESGEEAGVPPELAATARATGAITYVYENRFGLKPDCMFCFDLELPRDFTPHPADGEAEGFELWPLAQVADTVERTAEFKFNCNLVVIDFLVRHGFLAADRDDYLALCRGLRRW